jgi:hypothetical protein
VVLLTALASCGDPAREEVFESSRAQIAGALGTECGEVIPDLGNATVVEDRDVPECEGGVCVRRGPDQETSAHRGVCSCRCDGPAGSGPYCSCGEGFTCEHLIDALAPGTSSLAGSYCMPKAGSAQ